MKLSSLNPATYIVHYLIPISINSTNIETLTIIPLTIFSSKSMKASRIISLTIDFRLVIVSAFLLIHSAIILATANPTPLLTTATCHVVAGIVVTAGFMAVWTRSEVGIYLFVWEVRSPVVSRAVDHSFAEVETVGMWAVGGKNKHANYICRFSTFDTICCCCSRWTLLVLIWIQVGMTTLISTISSVSNICMEYFTFGFVLRHEINVK